MQSSDQALTPTAGFAADNAKFGISGGSGLKSISAKSVSDALSRGASRPIGGAAVAADLEGLAIRSSRVRFLEDNHESEDGERHPSGQENTSLVCLPNV